MHYIVLVFFQDNFLLVCTQHFLSSFFFPFFWCQVCSFHSLVVKCVCPIACLDLSSFPLSPLFFVMFFFPFLLCLSLSLSISLFLSLYLSLALALSPLVDQRGWVVLFFCPVPGCAQAFHRKSALASPCVFSSFLSPFFVGRPCLSLATPFFFYCAFVCVSFCRSVCLSLCLSLPRSVRLSVRLIVCLSA